MNKILKEKYIFESMLLQEKVNPLTVAYHGSLFSKSNPMSDLDVILILEKLDPEVYRKLRRVVKKISIHVGLTIVSVKAAGTVFGGLKYYDALHRSLGKERGLPLAYYKIATLNEIFRKFALAENHKKCLNVAKIITKTINNYSNTSYALKGNSLDAVIVSLEANLNKFYQKEKTKDGSYHEKVSVY